MKLKNFDFRIWNKKYSYYVTNDCSNPICIASDNTLKEHEKDYKMLSLEFSPYDSKSLIDREIKEEDYEVELFTGLYDKRGKKIYEGDILYYFEDCPEDEDFIYVVKFKNGAFYLVEPEDIDSVGEQGNVIYCPEEFEVVGNIHKNKDLLNTKE